MLLRLLENALGRRVLVGSQEPINRAFDDFHLRTLLVGVVAVGVAPPVEAALRVDEEIIGDGLRVEHHNVVALCPLIQSSVIYIVGVGTKVRSLLLATVEVDVEVALAGAISRMRKIFSSGVLASRDDTIEIDATIRVAATAGGTCIRHIQVGSAIKADPRVSSESTKVEGIHTVGVVGAQGVVPRGTHVCERRGEELAGKVITTVVDEGAAKVRAGISPVVGDPSVLRAVVEQGGDATYA